MLKPQSQQQFITLPKHAIVDENLTLAEKGLYVVLFSNSGKFNYSLSDEEEQVFRSLVEKGYIVKGSDSVDYQILRIPEKKKEDNITLEKNLGNQKDKEFTDLKLKYIKIIEDRVCDEALRRLLKIYYNKRFGRIGKFVNDKSKSQKVTITKTLDTLDNIPSGLKLASVQQSIDKEYFNFFEPAYNYVSNIETISAKNEVDEQIAYMQELKERGEIY